MNTLATRISLALVAAVLLLYAQVIGHQFVSFDDPLYVVANPWVRDGLSLASVHWAFSEFYAENWHPLTWLSHMLDVELFGVAAGPHLLVNAAIHAGSSVLLFHCLRAMTGATWPSAIAAGLFALHPLRVESVAWVSERKDVLGGFFFMLTLLAYARYTLAPSLRGYATVFGVFALGLMAKPMLVTLPLVLLLLDFWPLGRLRVAGATTTVEGELRAAVEGELRAAVEGERRAAVAPSPLRRLVVEKLPMLALSAGSSFITLAAQSGVASSLGSLGFGMRLANAADAYVAYLWSAIWPFGLSFFYPHPVVQSPELGGELLLRASLCGLVLLIGTGLALWSLRARPYLAVGWFWYLGMLVPVIGLLQVGVQSRADRYTYLPMIGIAIAVVWTVRDVASVRRISRDLLRMTLLALFCGYGVLTWIQVGTWRNEGTVFAHAIRATEGNYVAHNGLALLLERAGDSDAALKHYKAALEIHPAYADARTNLGNLYQRMGDPSGAEQQQRLAIAADPGQADGYNNLGVVLGGQGRTSEAIAVFEQALEVDPGLAEAHYNRSVMLERDGRADEALAGYRRALELRTDYADSHCALGVLLGKLGDLEGAARELTLGVTSHPSNAGCQFNYAVVLTKIGDLTGAAERLEAVLRLQPDFEQARRILDQLRNARQ